MASSLRKRIESVVGGGGVEIHVPPSDPMEQIVKQANTLGDQLTAIMDDRNRHKERSEQLMLMLQDANRMNERLLAERDEAHRQFLVMLHGNGKLKAMVDGIFSLINNGRDTLHHTDHLLTQQQPNPNGGEDVVMDLDRAPEPTADDLEQLRSTLAGLQAKNGGRVEAS